MNIKSLLHKSVLELKRANVSNPELDVKVLLEFAIEKNPTAIYSHPEYLITNAQYSKFRRCIRRRKTGEPIAYITGHKEFYGYDFLVNKNVLIPRPESEWLVEKGAELLSKLSVIGCQLSVLDMGCGSGCLAIALSKSIHDSQFIIHNSVKIYGVDFNSRAVSVAKINARKLKAKNVVFLNSNLFSNRRIKNKIFDIVIANLPYVPREKKIRNSKFEIQNKKGIDFEPQDAIFADDNGAAIIKKFLIDAKSHLSPTGQILLELDPRNAKALLDFAKKEYPNAKVDLKKDLASLDRYLTIYL